MSYISIWVHCVWTTKNRIPYLNDNISYDVISHILENSRSKGIYLDHLNGYNEHLHALISMGGKQNISDIIQKLKGESSFWINKNKLTRLKFEWQDDYYAVSVSKDGLQKIRDYIRNQVSHHKKKQFQNEIDDLIEEYGFERLLG